MIPSHAAYAVLAIGLLIALLATLALLFRWFVAQRATLIERLGQFSARVLALPVMMQVKRRYPRLWRFLAARFARGEYLGLHLTIGLALSLGGLWVFGRITEDVVHHDPLTQFDVMLSNWLQAHSTPGRSPSRERSVSWVLPWSLAYWHSQWLSGSLCDANGWY